MLQTRSIIHLLSWIITLPFYIYALLKWRDFKGHFLIQKRFPQISYTLFCIAFFGVTLSLIEDCLFDFNISSETVDHNIAYLLLSLNFAISGLVLYRINLIYLKWKSLPSISTSAMSTLSPPSISPDTDTNNTKTITIPKTTMLSVPTASSKNVSQNLPSTHPNINLVKLKESNSIKEIHNNIYSSWLSLLILFFIFIGTLIPYLSNALNTRQTNDIPYFIVLTEFAILWVLIALSIANIKHNKVTEGLGCIKECYAILISVLVQMLLQLQMFTPVEHTMRAEILRYTTIFVLHFGAMVTLYIPLLLLFRSEGTFNVKQYHSATDGKLFQDASVCVGIPEQNNHESNKETVLDLDINNGLDLHVWDVANSRTQMQQSNKNAKIIVNKCLFLFLYQNQVNHDIFANYLRFCFASENLLFVERVSIFYQIVLRLQNKYQMSLIRITNTHSETVERLSNLSVNIERLSNLSLPSTASMASNNLSFRHSDLSISRQSRVSAVYVNENGDIIHPRTDLNEQTNNKTGTPTMTAVTPIPKTFNNWNDTTPKKENKDSVFGFADLKYIYRFEFQYLSDIYAEYQQIIDTNHSNESGQDFEINNYKNALYAISKQIYDQFIAADSPSQVNLGFEVSNPLKFLLANGDQRDKFQNYDDFLRLFDGVVIETYRLMIHVFNYRFRQYVKGTFENAIFEK